MPMNSFSGGMYTTVEELDTWCRRLLFRLSHKSGAILNLEFGLRRPSQLTVTVTRSDGTQECACYFVRRTPLKELKRTCPISISHSLSLPK